MTILSNLNSQTSSLLEQKQFHQLPQYIIKLRQGQLLVKYSQQAKQIDLSTINHQQWIVESLKHWSIRLIRLEQLGEAELIIWANACKQVNKKVFLRIPCNCELPKKQSPLSWRLKRIIDWLAAALLLLALSPLMLMLALLMRIYSPGPIFFRQWRVGQRGKLFQIIKFRTMVVEAEKLHHYLMTEQSGLHKLQDDPRVIPLGRWMRKLSFDELPQLFNVLQGEMSLVGPRPWALYDALRISSSGQKRLKALPGITGYWQVKARSTLLDLDEVNNLDLEYLRNWSLGQDLKILLLTIPRVLFGCGAY